MTRNYSWPLFLVGAVVLTALALVGQGRLWSQPAAGDEELSLASGYAVFTLTAAGPDPLMGNFTSCSGLGMSNEIEYGFATLPPGVSAMQSTPGVLEAHEITLRSEEPGTLALWQWRRMMDGGSFNMALRDGSITMYNGSPEPVATWVFRKGWPAKVMFNEGKLEVVIAHAGVEMVSPGGGGTGTKASGRTK